MHTVKQGGSKTPTPFRIKPKALTVSSRIKLSLAPTHGSKSIREKIESKLIWFIHGAEKEHADVPGLSESSIAQKKRVPKTTFGPCNFDSLSFFSPSGHYAWINYEFARNIGTFLCNNQTEDRFEKIPDSNGNLQLRDMEFSVEPKTDPEAFKQGMSVYLCEKGKVTRLYDYNDLIQLGAIDLSRLISESNRIMLNLGYQYRKWDLLLCCCRVYQPNIVANGDGYRCDEYAPAYMVMPSSSAKPSRYSASTTEKVFGIPKKTIEQRRKHLLRIRTPKITRAESARRTVRLTSSRGGKRKSTITQVSEEDFYKSLRPIVVKCTKPVDIK